MAEALAQAAGIAIQNTRLNETVRLVGLLDDRDRIARDLHDRVIQRIFSVGMSLQGAVRMPGPPELISRVSAAVDALDSTIDEIRTAIFELEDGMRERGLRRSVLDLANELAPLLGSRPDVTFTGPVDSWYVPTGGRPPVGGLAGSADQRRQARPGDPVPHCRRRGRRTAPRSGRQREGDGAARRRIAGTRARQPAKPGREARWHSGDPDPRRRGDTPCVESSFLTTATVSAVATTAVTCVRAAPCSGSWFRDPAWSPPRFASSAQRANSHRVTPNGELVANAREAGGGARHERAGQDTRQGTAVGVVDAPAKKKECDRQRDPPGRDHQP